MNLPALALRILGCLLEKEATTPDAYPLSLNSLTAACNQLSNREPVMQLSEIDVRNAVNALRQEGLVRAIQPAGSKVMKFQHLLTEKLNLDARERAVLCVLMLRGPQTLAEIRARTARLAEFPSPLDVEATLHELSNRELAAEVGRQPGQKESRYVQLLGEDAAAEHARAGAGDGGSRSAAATELDDAGDGVTIRPDRIATLEAKVDAVGAALEALRSQLDELKRQLGE